MDDLELRRRKIHGILSSKSLLDSMDKLTLKRINIKEETLKTTKDLEVKDHNF
jgi:hypothetical protein